jgi:hypothetical protein
MLGYGKFSEVRGSSAGTVFPPDGGGGVELVELTLSVAAPETPSIVARTAAEPAVNAVTTPDVDTDAIAVPELIAQVAVLPVMTFPLPSRATAVA